MRRLILQIIFVFPGLISVQLVAFNCFDISAYLGGSDLRRALRATGFHEYDIPHYTAAELKGTGFPDAALPILNQLIVDYHRALESGDSTQMVKAAVKIFQAHQALTNRVAAIAGEESKQTGAAAQLEFARLHQLSYLLTVFPPASVQNITTEMAKLKLIAAARWMPHHGMTIKVVPKGGRNTILILPDRTTELGKLSLEAWDNSVFVVYDPVLTGSGAMFNHHSRHLFISDEAVLTGKIDVLTEHETDHYRLSMLEENGTPSGLHGEAEIHPDRAKPGEMLPTDTRKSVNIDAYGEFASLQELYTQPRELKNWGADAKLLPVRAVAAHDIGARFHRIGKDLLPQVAQVDRDFKNSGAERGRFSRIPEILPDGSRVNVPAIGSSRSWDADGTPHTMIGFRVTKTHKDIPYVEALVYDGPTLLRLKWFGKDIVDYAQRFEAAVNAKDDQIQTRDFYRALFVNLEEHLQWISQTGAQVRADSHLVLVTSGRYQTSRTNRQALVDALGALKVPTIQK